MRVLSQPGEPRSGAPFVLLALALAACSSTALAPPDQEESPAPAATGGSEPGSSPGSGATSSGGQVPSQTPTVDGDGKYFREDYPAGPYGVGLGATLEDFAFQGWRDPVAVNYDATLLETVRMAEFYNPDGRSNTRLIWINASAVWCSVCRREMQEIKDQGVRATMEPMGVQLIVTLFQDGASPPGPATPLDLSKWGSARTHRIDFPLLLDPGFKLGAFFTSDATPLNMLVDASTMKVVQTTMGYSEDYWQRVQAFLDQ